MELRPLNAGDLARLGMDTPENPMTVTAALRLEGRIDIERLLELVDARILVHQRMRDHVTRPDLMHPRPAWEEMTIVDARHQVTHLSILRPGELAALVSEIASKPLDPTIDPWRIWLIDEKRDDGHVESVLVFRVHHALADGLALLKLLFAFSDEGRGVLIPGDAGLEQEVPPPRTSREKLLRAEAIAKLVLRRADPPSCLRGVLSGEKRFAWTAPLPIDLLKRVAHSVDAKVNDVLLAALAGALRDLTTRGGDPAPPHLHALVPVALGSDDAGRSMGNHFVSLFVELPLDGRDPLARVIAARDAMRAARAESGIAIGQTLVSGASVVGRRIEQTAVRLFSKKASIVASDLVGPPAPLHLDGHAIRDVLFAAPAPGEVALTASSFGYAGAVRITIASDAAVMSDPAALVGLIEARIAELVAALGPRETRGGAS